MRTAIAVAFVASAPGLASAQARLSTTPLDVPLALQLTIQPPRPTVKAYPAPMSTAAPASDLFISYDTAFDYFAYRSLEGTAPFPFRVATTFQQAGAAGLLNENNGDGLCDIAYLNSQGNTVGPLVYFGDAPGTAHYFGNQPGLNLGWGALTFAHVLNKTRDALVFTNVDSLTAIDFGDQSSTPFSSYTWTEKDSSAADDALMQLRLSPKARAGGGVDLARNRIGTGGYGLDLFWLLDDAVLGAGTYSLTYTPAAACVPQGCPLTVPLTVEPHGAGALDVDFDGIPDLVVCLVDSISGAPGQLEWIKNDRNDTTGALLVAATPQDLGGQLGMVSPRLVRPLDLDGTPAIAVWDAGAAEILVVTSDPVQRQLRVWRGSTGGRWVFDIVAGNVVGSPLADLIVAYADPAAVQVFPDSGDAAPTVAWSTGLPPARAVCGFDLPLQVQASDDGTVTKVEWFVNGVLASTLTTPPYAFVVPQASLPCSTTSVQVTARAVDDVGLWNEVTAAIPVVVDAPPTIAWSAGSPPAQAPAGIDLPLEVQAADDLRVAAVQWFLNGSASPAAIQSAPPYAFTIPGASLCGAASVQVSVRALDDLGQSSQVTATIPLVASPPVLQVLVAAPLASQLVGSGQTLALRLAPGGASLTLTAQVSGPCSAVVAPTWTALLPGGVAGAPDGSSFTATVREEDYRGLLASSDLRGAVTAWATGPGGTTSATTQLLVDASGLLEVEHTSDRAALAPGDLALLTAVVRSSVAVSLGPLRIDDLLDGLEAAGPLRVVGATALDAQVTAGKASVTLEQVPGGSSPVTIQLPVRRTLARGGSSHVQAVALPNEAPLSPQGLTHLEPATPPGLGCSQTGGTPGWSIPLALWYAAGRLRSMRRWRRPPPPG